MKWVVQDHKSAFQDMKEKNNSYVAAGMGELLRLGPRPESAAFPPGHVFEDGFAPAFINSGILKVIISNTRYEWS